jgi:hypothetical protein
MRNRDRWLAAYGSDFSRWPDGEREARAALLSDRSFRAEWEGEREVDRLVAEERAALDAEIAASGAMTRLARIASRPLPAGAGVPWRRVAAGVLVAGVLGGALDLLIPQSSAEPPELAFLDPLASYDIADTR